MHRISDRHVSEKLDYVLSLAVLSSPALSRNLRELDLTLANANLSSETSDVLFDSRLTDYNADMRAFAEDITDRVKSLRKDDNIRGTLNNTPFIGMSWNAPKLAAQFEDIEAKHGLRLSDLEDTLAEKIDVTTLKKKDKEKLKSMSVKEAFISDNGFDFNAVFTDWKDYAENLKRDTSDNCDDVTAAWKKTKKSVNDALNKINNGSLGFNPEITEDNSVFHDRLLKLAQQRQGHESGLQYLVSNAALRHDVRTLQPNAASILTSRPQTGVHNNDGVQNSVKTMLNGGLNCCIVVTSPQVSEKMMGLFSKFMSEHHFERITSGEGQNANVRKTDNDVISFDRSGARTSHDGQNLVIGFADQRALNDFISFTRNKMTPLDHLMISKPIVALSDGRMGVLQAGQIQAPIAEGAPKLTRHFHPVSAMRQLPIPMAFVLKSDTPKDLTGTRKIIPAPVGVALKMK